MSFVALLVFTVLFLLKGILKEYMRIKCEIVTSTVRVIWEEFFFLKLFIFHNIKSRQRSATSQLPVGFLHACGKESWSKHATFTSGLFESTDVTQRYSMSLPSSYFCMVPKGFGIFWRYMSHIQHHLESKIGSIFGSDWTLNHLRSEVALQLYLLSPSAYGWVWVPMYARAALPALAAWEAAQKFTGSMICLKIITDQYESITNPQDPCKYGIFT